MRWGGHQCRCGCDAGQQALTVDRLLFTFATLPVPLGLTAALAAKGLLWTPIASAAASSIGHAAMANGVHTSLIGKLAQAVTAHPLAALATGVVLALGVWSLEAVGLPGQYMSYAASGYAAIEPVTASSSASTRQRATFTVVRGLADTRCYSLRAIDGRYLRHYLLRLQLSADDGTQLFREDATFCVLPGTVAGSVRLQSHNYPVLVLHRRDGGIYLDGSDGTAAFARESSFMRRDAWLK